jgi:hypothetical protein
MLRIAPTSLAALAAILWLATHPILAVPQGAWTSEGQPVDGHYGSSVSTAGDVNGDGYAEIMVGWPHGGVDADGLSDVIVGAPRYDETMEDDGQGRVYLGKGSEVEAR